MNDTERQVGLEKYLEMPARFRQTLGESRTSLLLGFHMLPRFYLMLRVQWQTVNLLGREILRYPHRLSLKSQEY